MPQLVTSGSMLQCTMGVSPSPLTADPKPATAPTPVAVITDFKPNANISSFGMCVSPANPQVAAATAAAQGVLTPQPCLPATTMPWAPGSTTSVVNGIPCVLTTSTCACLWAGVVSVVAPAQQLVTAI